MWRNEIYRDSANFNVIAIMAAIDIPMCSPKKIFHVIAILISPSAINKTTTLLYLEL